MTPKTIFTLILKIFGLYMFFNLIVFIPETFTKLPLMAMYPGPDATETVMIILGILLVAAVYFFLMRLFLFKSGWLIDKLSLDKHFEQEIIAIKADSAAVFQISIIVLGGIFFINALPSLLSDIISFLQQKQMEIILAKSPGFSLMVYNACKLLLGYLLLTNSKQLTAWVEQKNGNVAKNNTLEENQGQ